MFDVTVTNVRTGALSWWNNTFFFLISTFKCCNKFAQYSPLFSFLKIINKNYPTSILKHWQYDHDSRWNCLRLLQSRFFLFSSLSWPFFRLKCEVVDPCFSHSLNRHKNTNFLWQTIVKYSIKTSSRHYFCSIVSKHGIHLVHSILVSKLSVNM